MLGFAQILRATGEIAGSTSFLAIEPAHRRLEIGATWLNPRHQRTGANTEAKLLLLRHAFEALGCERVEFKTDAENKASRAALARIGAREEGTLRSHMGRLDGSRRDSVYFGVIAPEWPHVRAHLEGLLARARSRQTR
jgi:RimJ/RimL family protein N-acetyltransferase